MHIDSEKKNEIGKKIYVLNHSVCMYVCVHVQMVCLKLNSRLTGRKKSPPAETNSVLLLLHLSVVLEYQPMGLVKTNLCFKNKFNRKSMFKKYKSQGRS